MGSRFALSERQACADKRARSQPIRVTFAAVCCLDNSTRNYFPHNLWPCPSNGHLADAIIHFAHKLSGLAIKCGMLENWQDRDHRTALLQIEESANWLTKFFTCLSNTRHNLRKVAKKPATASSKPARLACWCCR